MSQLPDRPDLAQLRRRAREPHRAAAGDGEPIDGEPIDGQYADRPDAPGSTLRT